MLDAALWEGGLFVTDWSGVVHLAVDVAGQPLMPDVDLGRYVRPGDDATFVFYNRGDAPLTLVLPAEQGMAAETVALPPGKTSWTLPSEALALAASGPGAKVERTFLTQELLTALGDQVPTGWELPRVGVLVREANQDPTLGFPAPGDPFPSLLITQPGGAAAPVPLPGEPSLVVFYTDDCAAMWPELLDLVWLASKGEVPGGAAPLAINGDSTGYSWFVDHWGLEALHHFQMAGPVSDLLGVPELGSITYGQAMYDDLFQLIELPGGAKHPTDYYVDANQTVVHVSRTYRGRWQLREE
jgi:hypothetical protein